MPIDRLQRMRALCEADPNNAFAWYTLAMEQKKTDAKAALAIFAEVHAKHPNYVANYFHYAKTLDETGDTARAAEIYRAGIEVARKAGDLHAVSELQQALDLLS